jgi:DNA invertase Pin-like site-specific DNA recombinase
MLAFVEGLRMGSAGLRALNLGGEEADTSTPMGSMVITVMATRVLTDWEITREMSTDSMSQGQPTDNDFGGRRPTCTDSPIRSAVRPIKAGEDRNRRRCHGSRAPVGGGASGSV